MRRSVCIWVCIYVNLLLLSAYASCATAHALYSAAEQAWIASHPVVHIAVDPDLRPIEYLENGRHKGLTAEYLNVISKASGLRFEVVPTDITQLTEALNTQRIDLVTAVSPHLTDPAIRERLIISPPYFVGGSSIIARESSAIVFEPYKLNGKTVAIKNGGIYELLLRQNYPDIKLLLEKNSEQSLAAVADGRADAAIGIDATMLPVLYRKYRNLLHVAGTLVEFPAIVSIGVRKDLPLLASIVEKSLGTLTAKQTDIMVNRWLENNNYGAPSWSAILLYRPFESALVLGTLLLVLIMAQQARRARRAAEQSEREKARFLAVMSHEIRTPMNAILSSVELLARSTLTAQQRQLSDLASTASEALLALLDDVLDLSKLEAQRVILTLAPTDMQQLASGVIEISGLQARKKNLSIELGLDLPSATDLLLDPGRVRQILINLLSNAVKFTEHGKVRLTLALEQIDAAQATLVMVVSDTGIGISAEQQQHLFKPFTQVQHASTRRFGGSGLGLTICRELSQRMGGSITLSSTLGIGTCVTCRIPVELLAAASLPAPPIFAAATASFALDTLENAPHILVVEDHPANRLVLEQQLQQLGYRCTMVSDGRSALDLTAQHSFAMMLLDCYLPDLDGYAVASEQRAREASSDSHLPIIAISAAFDQQHLDACLRCGMDGTLRKPLRLEDLRTLLSAWCGPGANVATETVLTAPPVALSHNSGTILSALFVQTTREDLQQLTQALQHLTDAARTAHKIRGAALVCQQSQVAALALALEQTLLSHPKQLTKLLIELQLALQAIEAST